MYNLLQILDFLRGQKVSYEYLIFPLFREPEYMRQILKLIVRSKSGLRWLKWVKLTQFGPTNERIEKRLFLLYMV